MMTVFIAATDGIMTLSRQNGGVLGADHSRSVPPDLPEKSSSNKVDPEK
jgi:hypothetical protein